MAISPLLDILIQSTEDEHNKLAAFADDVGAAGKLLGLRAFWSYILESGPKYGYNPQPAKSWLIVKPEKVEEARRIFEGTGVQITVEGERHLGAVIGNEEYKQRYIHDTVMKWVNEVSLLSDIATTQPQAAYTCFTAGYQHKMTYFLRTIAGMEHHMQALEEVIRHRFIPLRVDTSSTIPKGCFCPSHSVLEALV